MCTQEEGWKISFSLERTVSGRLRILTNVCFDVAVTFASYEILSSDITCKYSVLDLITEGSLY